MPTVPLWDQVKAGNWKTFPLVSKLFKNNKISENYHLVSPLKFFLKLLPIKGLASVMNSDIDSIILKYLFIESDSDWW